MRSFPKMLRNWQTHKNESKCAWKFICALTVHCASGTTVRLLDGLEQVKELWGERWYMWGVGFTNRKHWQKHFDLRQLKLLIVKLNWSFEGLGESLENLKNVFFQFDHPHIINVNGRVLFCRDCWEEDGVCRGWDFGEAGVVTVQCKGKQSSALVYPRVLRVGWRLLDAHLATFRSKRVAFDVHFSVIFGVIEQAGPGHSDVQ